MRRDPAWVRALEEPVERFLSAFRVPLAAALFVAAGTIWVYGIMLGQQDAQIARIAEARMAQVRSEAALELQLRVAGLDEVARIYENRPSPDFAIWRLDAEILLRRNMQYRAVAWLDPGLATVAAQPTTAGLPGWALGPAGNEARVRTLTSMMSLAGTGFSRSYVLDDGSRQVLVRAPMLGNDGRTSYLIGVMRSRDLIDALVGALVRSSWSVAVYEGPYLLFGEDWSEAGEATRWTREVEVVNGELGLRIRLWPSEELLEHLRSTAPRAVLVAGIFLALVIALLVRRTQVLSRRLAVARGQG